MLFHDCGSPLELLWGQGVDTCLKTLWEDYAHANLNCKRYWENWPILSFLLGHFFKLGKVFQTKLWTDGSDLDPSVWPHCNLFLTFLKLLLPVTATVPEIWIGIPIRKVSFVGQCFLNVIAGKKKTIKAASLISACPSKRCVFWNSDIHSNRVPTMHKLPRSPGIQNVKSFSWKTHNLPCVMKYWQIITVEGDTLHFCCSPGNNLQRKPGFVSGFDNILNIFLGLNEKRVLWI